MANATTKKSRIGLNATAAVAGTALLLGGGIAVANAALPAGSAGTVTANNTTGSWTTADMVALKLHSDMVCPTVGGMMAGALIFMSEVGQEIKPATAATEAQTVYPFSQDPMYQMSLNPNGTIADDNTLESGFFNSSKSPIADMAAAVEANHAYSIGYVCTILSDDFRTATINPVSGTTVASWATLSTDASKNWTISEPVVTTPTPTATETATPTPTPTATETATPTPTATATETATPSESATPTETPSTAPTGRGATSGGTSTPLATTGSVVELTAGAELVSGQKHVVNAPAGTFVAGETVTGEIQSDPVVLSETAVANADGSVSYTFTVPAGLPAGTHTLVLKGAAGATYEVTGLTVTTASNAPFLADTNWFATATSSPASTAGLAAMVLGGLTLMGVGGGIYFVRRRKGSRA